MYPVAPAISGACVVLRRAHSASASPPRVESVEEIGRTKVRVPDVQHRRRAGGARMAVPARCKHPLYRAGSLRDVRGSAIAPGDRCPKTGYVEGLDFARLPPYVRWPSRKMKITAVKRLCRSTIAVGIMSSASLTGDLIFCCCVSDFSIFRKHRKKRGRIDILFETRDLISLYCHDHASWDIQ